MWYEWFSHYLDMIDNVGSIPIIPTKQIIWCLSPSGKASGCDSDMRGFDPHQTPQGDVAQLVRAQDS